MTERTTGGATDDLACALNDWQDEYQQMRGLLLSIEPQQWELPTPAVPWTVRHQLGHLLWTDRALLSAVTEPTAFDSLRATVEADMTGTVDDGAFNADNFPVQELLGPWHETLVQLQTVLREQRPERVPWFGPPMKTRTAVSARIMELFAHGQDVRDALGHAPQTSSRLWHTIDLAIKTRRYALNINGLADPSGPIRVEVTGPDGDWTWGPEDATDQVRAETLDFALLATHRRHPHELQVHAQGDEAQRWVQVVQAYAGPPGTWPAPIETQADT